MHLCITAQGKQITFAVYREFRFFVSSSLSLPLPSTTSNRTSHPGNKFDIFKNLRMTNPLCLLTAAVNITEIKVGKWCMIQSEKKKINTRAHAYAHAFPWDSWLRRTQTLILKWKPHHGDELSAQHLTPRCLVSASSEEGSLLEKTPDYRNPVRIKATSLFHSVTRRPETFQSEQQSGENLKAS